MDTKLLTTLSFLMFSLSNIVQDFLAQQEHELQQMTQLLSLDYASRVDNLPWLETNRRENVENKVTELELLIGLIRTVKQGRRPRAFWSIRKLTGSFGFWEKQVLEDWAELQRSGKDLNDYIRTRFKEAVRMEPDVFTSLVEICEPLVSKKCTLMRDSISTEKQCW